MGIGLGGVWTELARVMDESGLVVVVAGMLEMVTSPFVFSGGVSDPGMIW